MTDRTRQYGPIESIRLDHVNRYRFAASRIGEQKRVLDAACGCGYGSKIIADAGNRVVGVDVSREAIEYAELNYHGPGYLLGSILDKPWVGIFDSVVSFETVEHLAEPEKALHLFRESVDGLFIVSTPNESLYHFDAGKFKDDDYPHLRHYTPEELDEILEKCDFKVVERNCQKSKKGEIESGTDGIFLIYVCK
jgi:2-polyprenyl-3-methyl-5-hydroxy-6-metoxy-1,4-benzoquinol methylase